MTLSEEARKAIDEKQALFWQSFGPQLQYNIPANIARIAFEQGFGDGLEWMLDYLKREGKLP